MFKAFLPFIVIILVMFAILFITLFSSWLNTQKPPVYFEEPGPKSKVVPPEVLRTKDGGKTWQSVLTGPASANQYRDIACPDTNTCYLIQNGPTFLASTDLGTTWLNKNAPTGFSGADTVLGTGPGQLNCPAVKTCFLIDASTFFATVDGGNSWASSIPVETDTSTFKSPDLSALDCFDASNCVVASSRGVLVTTEDGGKTWKNKWVEPSYHLTGLECPTTNFCIAVGSYSNDKTNESTGIIVTTQDGGKTWNAHKHEQTFSLDYIQCMSSNICIAKGVAGPGGTERGDLLYKSVDGGKTWKALNPLFYAIQTSSINCPAENICYITGHNWALGRYDTVGLTTNEGATWNSTYTGINRDHSRLNCVSTEICFVFVSTIQYLS
ncbi:MAG: hypothetical protein J0I20_02835 [Chloroflexi bacterium]|nr:hypothetical protein [Chloroflexota bacterium]OJV89301.1 MAG: hypothetical protein BGO39_35515 [Chloroflexi bacterium 54-19]